MAREILASEYTPLSVRMLESEMCGYIFDKFIVAL